MGGRLPVLEGFALPGDHPLNRYQRAYYQSAVQVSSTASGGSVVRVSTKVTAWYADSSPSRSGYQLLTSNGRLESDLLDQLTDLLASTRTMSRWEFERELDRKFPAAILRRLEGASTSGQTHCRTDHLGADAPVAGNRAYVLVFGGARFVESATGGFEGTRRPRSTGDRLAGRGREFGGSAQEPGASEESGGDKENRELRWLRPPV